MVTTGFSRVHVALYSASGGTVTYSGCRELARAKSMETDVETTDDNKFYANNRVGEIEPAQFKSGTAKVTVDGLDGEEEAFILGITPTTANGENDVSEVQYGESMNPPYLGLGAVKRMQLNSKVSYRPVLFTKARCAIPSETAETQEEAISWQTEALSFTLLRDDSSAHIWKIIPKVNFDTEDEAVEYIRKKLNYSEPGGLSV